MLISQSAVLQKCNEKEREEYGIGEWFWIKNIWFMTDGEYMNIEHLLNNQQGNKAVKCTEGQMEGRPLVMGRIRDVMEDWLKKNKFSKIKRGWILIKRK